jgi:hypothetical protein
LHRNLLWPLWGVALRCFATFILQAVTRAMDDEKKKKRYTCGSGLTLTPGAMNTPPAAVPQQTCTNITITTFW